MTNGWLRLLVGACIVLVLGAIFWLGAAYQRFSGMEAHLVSIDSQVGTLVQGQYDMKDAVRREEKLEDRVEKLENTVRQLK